MKLTNREHTRPIHTTLRYAGAGAVACLAIAAANTAMAGAGLVPHKAISISGVPGATGTVSSFDISYVDGLTHTYILGDRTNNGVDVIDTKTNTLRMIAGQGKFKGVVAVCAVANSCSGPNGVLIVNGTTDGSGNITGGEIWAGDAGAGLTSGPGCTAPSQCSSVKVLDLVTGALKANINTGGMFRADEMCFDPKDNLVMATNNADTPPYANIIDASTKQIVAQIPWNQSSNGAEQCIYDSRTGLFYETLPEAAGPTGPGDNSQPGAIVVVDPKIAIAQNFTGGGGVPGPGQGNDIPVVATYFIPLSQCDGPQGMAVGPTPQILVGCNGGPASAQSNDASVVLNDGSTGGVPMSVIAELPNQDGPDMVDFDSSSRLYTFAKSTKTVTNLVGNVGMVSATTFQAMVNIPTVATSGGAHSVASDPDSRSTYVPIPSASAASKLCSSAGGVDANGCILQLTRSITDTHDFDANTASDILWRDTAGNVGMWLMSLNTGTFQQQTGKIGLQSTAVLGNISPTTWSIVGQSDFAGSGFGSVLWRDTSGDLAAWQMNGSTIQNVTSYTPLPSTTSVVGTGQFNANGMGDILVQNGNNLAVVFMNGPDILATKPIGALPAGFTVAGSDQKGAIFLRNTTTGDVGVWLIGCTSLNVASNATSCSPVNTIDFGPVPLTWQIVGIGDFDGNGSSDILFKDSSNNVGVWLLEINEQTIKILSTKVLGAVPAGWNVALTGDFNGVGKADVLWMDGLGNVGAWAMNGAAISAVVSFGNVGPSWAVQGLNAQ